MLERLALGVVTTLVYRDFASRLDWTIMGSLAKTAKSLPKFVYRSGSSKNTKASEMYRWGFPLARKQSHDTSMSTRQLTPLFWRMRKPHHPPIRDELPNDTQWNFGDFLYYPNSNVKWLNLLSPVCSVTHFFRTNYWATNSSSHSIFERRLASFFVETCSQWRIKEPRHSRPRTILVTSYCCGIRVVAIQG